MVTRADESPPIASGPCFALISLSFVGDVVERLVPGGLLELAVLADERGGQAVGRVDKLVGEAPLDAEASPVGGAVAAVGGDLHDLSVIDIEVELAAHAAIGAGRADLLDLPGASLEAALLVDDGPRGAVLHALAAEDAGGLDVILVEGRAHLHAVAALGEIEHLVDLDLVAASDAAPAEHALVEIALDHRVRGVQGIAGGVDLEAGLFDAQTINKVLQLALPVGLALQAVVVARGPDELHHHLPRLDDPGGVRPDLHAGACRHGAGSHEISRALLLNDTDAAGAHKGRSGEVAERGDVKAILFCYVENGLPGRRLALLAVDEDAEFAFHFVLPPGESISGYINHVARER